jgi:orotidine-5'-phosphate decarboxylase
VLDSIPLQEVSVKDRLIVALDVPSRVEAIDLIQELSGVVGMFKIGSQLFTAEGPDLVRQIIASGERVFLDLKFHDIPNTVALAVEAASRLGVSLLNVHALGGPEMMRAAARAVADRGILWIARPAVLGVTVLTSLDDDMLDEVGIKHDVKGQVVRLAALAHESGLDGVIASPNEIRLIREYVAAREFLIITPGVRPAWFESGDQKRTATPELAFLEGADFIVVGRPITASSDPRSAAERVLDEISRVL